jgi:putative proteasome-type protease
MKSNISVGPPINLISYTANSFNIKHQLRLRIGDPYLAKIRKLWETSLRQAFDQMPAIEWDHDLENFQEDVFTD